MISSLWACQWVELTRGMCRYLQWCQKYCLCCQSMQMVPLRCSKGGEVIGSLGWWWSIIVGSETGESAYRSAPISNRAFTDSRVCIQGMLRWALLRNNSTSIDNRVCIQDVLRQALLRNILRMTDSWLVLFIPSWVFHLPISHVLFSHGWLTWWKFQCRLLLPPFTPTSIPLPPLALSLQPLWFQPWWQWQTEHNKWLDVPRFSQRVPSNISEVNIIEVHLFLFPFLFLFFSLHFIFIEAIMAGFTCGCFSQCRSWDSWHLIPDHWHS